MENALHRITGHKATLAVAGRTDAGVHARAQVASFELPEHVQESKVANGLNSLLGPEVAVGSCRLVEDGFHARFSACWRSYRYLVLTAETHDPFRAATTWHYPARFDVAAMDAAVRHLVGEHDFASFCRVPLGGTARRRVLEAGWMMGDDQVAVLTIAANSFCHQMVRSVAGFSTEVGRGRVEPEPRSPTSSRSATARRLAGWPPLMVSPSGRSDMGSGPMSDDRPEAVLFDAGGTLVVIDAGTLAERLAPLGVAVPEQDVVTAAHYRAMAEFSDHLSAGDEVHWEWWIYRFLDLCGIAATRPVLEAVDGGRWLWHHPLPGAVEAVRLLAAKGFRVAVVSNSDGTVAEELITAGFDGLFETVVDFTRGRRLEARSTDLRHRPRQARSAGCLHRGTSATRRTTT